LLRSYLGAYLGSVRRKMRALRDWKVALGADVGACPGAAAAEGATLGSGLYGGDDGVEVQAAGKEPGTANTASVASSISATPVCEEDRLTMSEVLSESSVSVNVSAEEDDEKLQRSQSLSDGSSRLPVRAFMLMESHYVRLKDI